MTNPKQPFASSLLDLQEGRVELIHGSGGRATAELIAELFCQAFDNAWLQEMNDQACFSVATGRMVISTDCHVVSPLFFPGGDIGSLSVYGTINDVAMAGATPLYLAAGFILEEGFPLADLQRVVASMARAAQEAHTPIITGDTKVVEQGKGDGVYITTTGVGVVPEGLHLSADQARPGDKILLSGTIGDHGVAVMTRREGLRFDSPLLSDSQPLHGLVQAMLATGATLRCLRDPTRGGLAAALNEIAAQSGVGMLLYEDQIPVRPEVRTVCELLGIEPLHIANEGKLVAFCPPDATQTLLTAMQAHPQGTQAAIIGEVTHDPHHLVQMQTTFGPSRLVDWLRGNPLPRIC